MIAFEASPIVPVGSTVEMQIPLKSAYNYLPPPHPKPKYHMLTFTWVDSALRGCTTTVRKKGCASVELKSE